MRRKIRNFCWVLVAITIVFACRKKEPETPPTNLNNNLENEGATIFQQVCVDVAFADIINIGAQVSENGSLTTYKNSDGMFHQLQSFAPCATITASVNTYTVDFGISGCQCTDGKLRRGKLIYDHSMSSNGATTFKMPGYSLSIRSEGYIIDESSVYINEFNIKNTTPLSVIGQTVYSGTNLVWTSNSILYFKDISPGDTIICFSKAVVTLSNSNNPLCYKGQFLPIDWTKAIVSVSASEYGKTKDNEFFTAKITNLTKDYTCTWNNDKPTRHPFVSGTIDFKPGSRSNRYIDYGNGSCDLKASLTIGGSTGETDAMFW